MAKLVPDAIIDSFLDIIAACDTLVVCSTQPTTYTEATVTYALADVTLTPGAGAGDFTIANGDVSGRKLTVAAQSAVPIDASGTAQHVALCLTTGTSLRLVTTCTSQALTAGGTVDVPAFDYEITDVA